MTDEDTKKAVIICCVLPVSIVILFIIIPTPTISVYFDNGYENDFDIFVDGIHEGSVGLVSMEKISIKEGEHRIEIRKKDGKVFESNNVTLIGGNKYIYNIGRKYFYYLEICEYKVGGGTKWGGWDTKNIGSETFINYPDADYDFNENCPGSIPVPAGKTYVTRTKLKRRNNPTATELEKEWYSGSGGGALDVGQTSIIEFDAPKTVDRAYIKVGCNDGEKMDGYIEYWSGQKSVYLTSFSDAGCGDYVNFSPATTDKLRLTMTGGGGDDEHISWHGGGSAGWKVHVAADEGNEKESHPASTEQTGTADDISQPEKEGWYHGTGGGALDVGQTSTISFDSPKIVDRAYIKVGCNDGEKMDGYIEYWDGQKWINLTSFSDASCGDYVHFNQVTTDKLRLTMTGGGGNDEHISWHGGGSDGWKAHVAADEGNEKESYG